MIFPKKSSGRYWFRVYHRYDIRSKHSCTLSKKLPFQKIFYEIIQKNMQGEYY